MKHRRNKWRNTADQSVLVILHRYLVEPFQVLIQASCGILNLYADPADELDVLLKASHVMGSSIISKSSSSRDCRRAWSPRAWREHALSCSCIPSHIQNIILGAHVWTCCGLHGTAWSLITFHNCPNNLPSFQLQLPGKLLQARHLHCRLLRYSSG